MRACSLSDLTGAVRLVLGGSDMKHGQSKVEIELMLVEFGRARVEIAGEARRLHNAADTPHYVVVLRGVRARVRRVYGSGSPEFARFDSVATPVMRAIAGAVRGRQRRATFAGDGYARLAGDRAPW